MKQGECFSSVWTGKFVRVNGKMDGTKYWTVLAGWRTACQDRPAGRLQKITGWGEDSTGRSTSQNIQPELQWNGLYQTISLHINKWMFTNTPIFIWPSWRFGLLHFSGFCVSTKVQIHHQWMGRFAISEPIWQMYLCISPLANSEKPHTT